MAGKIAYCEIPTRFTHFPDWEILCEKIEEKVRSCGNAPVIPFKAGPYKDFEGNPKIGRERTLRFTIGLKNACCDYDEFFGVSDGTMRELKDTLDLRDRGIERDVRVHYGIDPEWEKYYEELKPKYGDLFARLRGQNYLIALVGPSAIGKTFWSEHLIKLFCGKLQRVKNTTTRLPRDEKDYESYNFVSREEFKQGIRENRFLEYVEHHGSYYGSSLQEIKKVLAKSSGIFAITPLGAKALYECRFEINLKIIRMVPRTAGVLEQNFLSRKITDPAEKKKLLAEANEFILPEEIKHDFVLITRDEKLDERKMLSLVCPLIS